MEQIHRGYGEASSGVYRVAGTAHDRDTCLTWALILKILGPRDIDTPALTVAPYYQDDALFREDSAAYWRKEALLYCSGLLDNLPTGLSAPRCLGMEERGEREVWLWLEEVTDSSEARWSLETYAAVAHSIGLFNGAYLTGRPLPAAPWLAAGAAHAWAPRAAPAIAAIPALREHPIGRQFLTPDVADGLLRLWANRHRLLDAVNCLPRTFCHADLWRRNLFTRPQAEGDRLVAIDWASAGVAPIGEDIGMLIATTIAFGEVERAQVQDLEEAVLAAYLRGLSEATGRDVACAVHLGYSAAIALGFGLGRAPIPVGVALDERRRPRIEREVGMPVGDLLASWADTWRLAIAHGDTALDLMAGM
jgi:hypothetical protein